MTIASHALAPVLALVMGCAPALAQENAQPRDAARAVLQVFEAACVECHAPGSDDQKARKYWADARDLAATRTELVDLADPEFSLLWEQIDEGYMPPKEARHGPLDEADKATVLAWIRAGAPDAAAGEPEPPPQAEPPSQTEPGTDPRTGAEPDEPAKPDERSVLGPFHPVTVHFPIAFLLGAALAELLVVVGFAGLAPAARFCVALSALSAPLTALAGWGAGEQRTRFIELLTWHRWLGVSVATLSLLLFVTSELRARRPKGRAARLYRWLLFGLAALVTVTAHLGGELTHGPGYLPLPW